MTLPERIDLFITSERLLTPGARVIVGLSGGADSSALLAVLSRLGYECVAVHCHFGLRGAEADRDLDHSRALAARFGAQFRSVKFNTREYMRAHGVSVEMACRELRYDYFERLRAECGAEAIAVGHHREDNVETFFLNLLRGSGIHGLRGMLPRRGSIVRPLLLTPRAELLEFLSAEDIPYITDSTNAENEFKRNRLRNVVIPALEREFPGAVEAVSRSIGMLRGNEALYNSLLPDRGESLAGAPSTLIHEWMSSFGFNADQCARMATAASGAVFTSPTHVLTLCPAGRYDLRPLGGQLPRPRLTGTIIPRPENFRPEPGVLYLDADALPEAAEWVLRPCAPGDRMRPFGMRGSKPVSDILAEAGVPASERGARHVLTLNGDVLWVVDFRTSALYNITETTNRIIEIRHEEI